MNRPRSGIKNDEIVYLCTYISPILTEIAVMECNGGAKAYPLQKSTSSIIIKQNHANKQRFSCTESSLLRVQSVSYFAVFC